MGKKDKTKKKVKGAEKTAIKTEKKFKNKVKKETGEDDIESVVKAIEEEERKRKEVKETSIDPPSHRSNFSMTAHVDNPEIVFFGGEFYNGQKTLLYKDLIFYNIKRKEWSQIKSPCGPPSRCSHQAVMTSSGGGQLWVFGGEYASPSETQFYHYKDLWCYHFSSKRWEKIAANGGPSARSGHRMVLFKRHLIIFGGFHDNLRECKYFNDVHAFDLDNQKWKKLDIVGTAPSPRSACVMFTLTEGRIVIMGGYCKEKGKKESEKGTTLTDMFILAPDKHDESLSKWKWHTVKQVGQRPSPRTGMSVAIGPNSNKVFIFGGVQDVKEDDEELESQFFNDLHTVNIENEKATWIEVQLSGKKSDDQDRKSRRSKKDENLEQNLDEQEQEEMSTEERLNELQLKESQLPKTVTVEEGAFTVTSTVNPNSTKEFGEESSSSKCQEDSSLVINKPCPRFGSGLTFKQGSLYLFGGMIEEGDVTYTLKDFYSLDTHKLDEWQTLIENDVKSMEWFDSDDEDEDDDDDGDDDDDDDEEDDEEDDDMEQT